MIDPMPRKMPPYVVRERSRYGKMRLYFRIGKGKRFRLPDDPRSPEFAAQYKRLLAGDAPEAIRGAPAAGAPGTLKWLCQRHMESAEWAGLAPATRRQRGLFYSDAIKRSNNAPFARISGDVMRRAMADRAATPALANNFLKAMRGLFRWARRNGHIEIDPTADVERIRYKSKGFPAWSAEDIQRFCERWPAGTKPRLALELLLIAGIRRGDLHVAGRQHLRGDIFSMQTAKTGTRITIRFPQSLLDLIEATPTGDLHFLTRADGKPFTSKESLGNWFSAQCRAAGVGKSAHGLRKLAATIAAESGATTHELMARFGWVDVKEAEIYTRAADRKRLGLRSSDAVLDQIANILPRPLNSGAGKIAKSPIKSRAKK